MGITQACDQRPSRLPAKPLVLHFTCRGMCVLASQTIPTSPLHSVLLILTSPLHAVLFISTTKPHLGAARLFQPGLFTGNDPTRGSGHGGFKISRVGSGRVIKILRVGSARVIKMLRVGSARVKRFPKKSRGSGRVKRFQNLTGRVKRFSKSRGSGRVGS